MIVTQTPLRLSFFGGGTDLAGYYRAAGGAVLSTAIDKHVYVIVKRRFDDAIYINYSQKEIVATVDEIQHDLVREAMRLTGVENGIEITTLADVPSTGTGLGSSSAVTVGLLHAFYAYQGQLVDAATLAAQACQIEIDLLSRPGGKQDQYIAAYGGIRTIYFEPDGAVRVEPVRTRAEGFRRLQQRVLVFFTVARDRRRKFLAASKRILIPPGRNSIRSRPMCRRRMSFLEMGISTRLANCSTGRGSRKKH